MEKTSSISFEGHSPMDEKELDEKASYKNVRVDVESAEIADADSSERDITTQIVIVADDPSLNPWTLRAFIIGIGLSAFGSILAEIYYFKPKTVSVSTMFLAIVSYVLGTGMDILIPRRGFLRYLNPHPFNKKENVFIVIMSSAAANVAFGTEVLAVQRLFYGITPNAGASLFLLFASQLTGYGISGLLRSVLLYPSKMSYPGVLPLVSMFDALYKDVAGARKKLKLFWFAFIGIFFWELLPEWMFPLLTGFSIFCLANPRSQTFTRLFGGTNGNEGLGLLSICFDWQSIAGSYNPMAIPLQVSFSNWIGYVLCIAVFSGVYYMDIWKSRGLPFLSQSLFYENGSTYDQMIILDDKFEIDPVSLAEQGVPFYAATWVLHFLTTNLALSAAFTHVLVWFLPDIQNAWNWMLPSSLKKMWVNFDLRFWRDDGMREYDPNDKELDPHFREMLKYPDAPNSWFLITLALSFIVALAVIYKTDSTFPWWGLIIAILLATVSIIFFGLLYAVTGLAFSIQTWAQMIGGFLHPGKPMANMYFLLFSHNSVNLSTLYLRDMKIAQYTKLPPRATFCAQITGTLVGCILNFVMMNSIVNDHRDILLSVEGTNMWSGQQSQQFNFQAIAWSSLSHELFAAGKRYQFVAWASVIGFLVPVPFWLAYRWWPKMKTNYLLTPIICYNIGWLCIGVSSPVTSYFVIALVSQWFLRTRYPVWFAKYNYILAAALDGGTQIMVFILSFAVQGASGKAHLFPQWWGANQAGNYDRCARIDT